MSSGAKGGASRVSIPSGVKKTIDNIKEITGQNHSEDEIYSMLKECSMDPNETAQRLLLLDTFHEVKRKRDRRKENQNKEASELKWKPGPQARGSRVGRGNYPSRYASHDVGGGRNSFAVKENATGSEKGSKAHMVLSKDMRKSETSSVASSITAVSNGPSGITSESANVIHKNNASAGGGCNQSNTTSSTSVTEEALLLSSQTAARKNFNAPGTKEQHQILENSTPFPSALASGSHLSSSDPILLPSPDFPLPSAVGTILREVGSHHSTAELIDDNPSRSKPASVKQLSPSDMEVHNAKLKVPDDFPVVIKNQNDEVIQTTSPSVSRPSSNYNNRSQGLGVHKVGPGKEWKPKTANANTVQDAANTISSEVSAVSIANLLESQTINVVPTLKEDTLELQRKLEESHIADSQHVIIPNHLHVPEIGKLGFCFGSFDASFGLDINQKGVLGSEKSPPESESSEPNEEPVNEPRLSDQNVTALADDSETKYPDNPQSPSPGPEVFPSNEVEVSSSIVPTYNESKPEVTLGSHQYPAAQTSSNYNIGVMPTVLSGHLTQSESSESQAHDAPRLPSFVVPQSFDPASYYAQFYRSGFDSDGRISPFHSAVAANKYNGNAALVSTQSSQEGGVPLILSTASSTPLVTQAAGVMQSTISAAQQPLPVFRQQTGVHLPHYPPNYIPYSPYFPPFYVPPPAIHPYLSNGAFPQQPQAGSLYATATGTTAKYSASQYKQGSNTGSSAHMGLPGSYGLYGLSMANYSSGSATSAVMSTSNDDNSAPQNKENNGYVGGQQNEGSGVWFTTPSHDITALQTNSFYNLPPGQLAFAPTQPAHGTFTGIFHPAQAVTTANIHPLLQQSQSITNAGDMSGPPTGVYQQPQHAQLNWPSNY